MHSAEQYILHAQEGSEHPQIQILQDGKSKGSQDCSFKRLLRDTFHISGKSERSQSSEEAGNLSNSTTKAGFGNLPSRGAGGLASWGGELPHPVFW